MASVVAAPPRSVIIAGMPRSGTTWAFNVVRLAMRARTGDKLRVAFGRSKIDCDHELVKVHGWGKGPKGQIVLSYRNPVDIAASRARMGWPHDLETIRRDVCNFRKWQDDNPCFVFAYEAMVLDKPQMAHAMLLAIGIDVEKTEAVTICAEVDAIPDWDGTNPANKTMPHEAMTMMHHDHRRHGGRVGNRDGLDPAIAAAIEAEGWVLP